MLRLSTTLLLATCVLLGPAVALQTVITCEGHLVQHLSCDAGVISVQEALYGRADSETCSEGKSKEQLATPCTQDGVSDIIKRWCDGKKVCELSSSVFGTLVDPCVGTHKYLQTKYTCLPAIHQVICEQSLLQLDCDQGQIITVYGADYGRRDTTTCSYKQLSKDIANTDCSKPTSVVSSSCNGKNSCTIKASNTVFGDPCPGTYKYLEVAYICEYPPKTPEDSL